MSWKIRVLCQCQSQPSTSLTCTIQFYMLLELYIGWCLLMRLRPYNLTYCLLGTMCKPSTRRPWGEKRSNSLLHLCDCHACEINICIHIYVPASHSMFCCCEALCRFSTLNLIPAWQRADETRKGCRCLLCAIAPRYVCCEYLCNGRQKSFDPWCMNYNWWYSQHLDSKWIQTAA